MVKCENDRRTASECYTLDYKAHSNSSLLLANYNLPVYTSNLNASAGFTRLARQAG